MPISITPRFDVAILGGGIIGLATAHEILVRSPKQKVLLLEKEAQLAAHQSGHNSGVLHTGIYYKPGSLRAINCRAGKLKMERFCREQGIPFEICGKVIVAVSDSEIPALQQIFERGQANGVRCELIEPERLREIEPHAAGVKAIHVPEAGIVAYGQVCNRLAERSEAAGAHIVTKARVQGIHKEPGVVTIETTAGDFAASNVINCTGLQSDRIAQLTGEKPMAKIVPFRGEYYKLRPDAFHLCRNLIYPVPDANFPFLGVHFTRRIDGTIECGPNAVLAFAREGYRKRDISPRDLYDALTYSGFVRLAAKYWRMGAGEMWRSFSKKAFVKALQRLVPEIRGEHLVPGGAGVRAQAVSPDGTIVDDFLIVDSPPIINVCNAPSPAATSSLNIASLLVDKIAPRLG